MILIHYSFVASLLFRFLPFFLPFTCKNRLLLLLCILSAGNMHNQNCPHGSHTMSSRMLLIEPSAHAFGDATGICPDSAAVLLEVMSRAFAADA
jgi:hypothetical protein